MNDLKTPIGEFLRDAGTDGLILDAAGRGQYAVIPLDDDLLDYLVERSPKFIETCRQIRERVRAGQFHSHEDVKKLLQDD